MAVYTKLNRSDIEEFLACYDSVGELDGYAEISAGIENSNYFVDVNQNGQPAKYVLTLFENMTLAELPFFSAFTQYLLQKGLPVPAPVIASDGRSEMQLKAKPVVLVPCMPGQSLDMPNIHQCENIAVFLGRMHQFQEGFGQTRELVRGVSWMHEQLDLLVTNGIDSKNLALLKGAIERYEHYSAALKECPQGLVHGDLFRDNVLFSGDEVTGVIDFYHACRATFLFDLAVLINDWAWDEQTLEYDKVKMERMLKAYQSERMWSVQEYTLWPKALELAALRFWVSRLVSSLVPNYQDSAISGAPIKDPDEMRSKLLAAQKLS